jgi:hypothetical protein
MRYYWFRLADFALPLGAAFAWLAAALRIELRTSRAGRRAALAALLLVAATYLGMHGWAVLRADRPRADAANKVIDLAAWREVAHWAAQHTPAEAVFITPRTSQTFKWYAARSELATWKDLPQDAQGILEWQRRLQDLYGQDEILGGWGYKSLVDVPVERLCAVGQKYGAQYVIAEAEPPLQLPRLFANWAYAVYQLPAAEPSAAR